MSDLPETTDPSEVDSLDPEAPDPPEHTDDTQVEVPPLEHARPSDVIAALGFDPATVATVIISAAGVHAIATTLVESALAPAPEETPDADS